MSQNNKKSKKPGYGFSIVSSSNQINSKFKNSVGSTYTRKICNNNEKTKTARMNAGLLYTYTIQRIKEGGKSLFKIMQKKG